MSSKDKKISVKLIKQRSKHFDLSCITRLNLSNAGISIISNLESCENLVELDLSKNKLFSLSTLPSLSKLSSLDLSFNNISSLDELPPLHGLEELHLEGNHISNIGSANLLSKLPSLRRLYLQRDISKHSSANPVCLQKKYIEELKNQLPKLHTLDGEVIAFIQLAKNDAINLPESPEVALYDDNKGKSSSWEKMDWSLDEFDPSFVKDVSKKFRETLDECKEILADNSVEKLIS